MRSAVVLAAAGQLPAAFASFEAIPESERGSDYYLYRAAAVLSVGRMEPLEIPEKHEPWMHFHERLPWPMELSSRIDILGSGSSFKNLEHLLRMIRSQQLDYAEHGIGALVREAVATGA